LLEIFAKSEWQIIWDNIVANIQSIDFIYAVGLAYLVYNRNVLLKFQSVKEFEAFFHQLNQGIDFKIFLELVCNIKYYPSLIRIPNIQDHL
jgi:hypothetical protein